MHDPFYEKDTLNEMLYINTHTPQPHKRTPSQAQAEKDYYKLINKLKQDMQSREHLKKEKQREKEREEYLCM